MGAGEFIGDVLHDVGWAWRHGERGRVAAAALISGGLLMGGGIVGVKATEVLKEFVRESEKSLMVEGAPMVTPFSTDSSLPTVSTQNITPQATLISSPTSESQSRSTPTPETTKVPYVDEIVELDGVKVTFNTDGLPISYETPDRKITKVNPFDPKNTLDQAKKSGEPQIFTVISFKPPPVRDLDKPETKEHPTLNEKPKDALSTEQLKEKGIEIIQAANTELSIRQGAFDKGKPLASFADGSRKLQIIAVNGPIVDTKYMTGTQYTSEIKAALNNNRITPTKADTEKLRASLLASNAKSIEELRTEMEKSKQDADANLYETQQRIFIVEKYRQDSLKRMTDEELKEYTGMQSEVAGLYIPSSKTAMEQMIVGLKKLGSDASMYEKNLKDYPDMTRIFVAVGKNDPHPENIIVVALPNGRFEIFNLLQLERHSLNPTASQSFPDPSQFERNTSATAPDPNSYPIGNPSAGFIFRHERAHDELIRGNLDKGEKPDYSEYNTDMEAMRELQDAWNKWALSGYTDNTGYDFVFRLSDGTYILTEREGKNNKKINSF